MQKSAPLHCLFATCTSPVRELVCLRIWGSDLHTAYWGEFALVGGKGWRKNSQDIYWIVVVPPALPTGQWEQLIEELVWREESIGSSSSPKILGAAGIIPPLWGAFGQPFPFLGSWAVACILLASCTLQGHSTNLQHTATTGILCGSGCPFLKKTS